MNIAFLDLRYNGGTDDLMLWRVHCCNNEGIVCVDEKPRVGSISFPRV